MTDKWDDLIYKERILSEKSDDDSRKVKQTKQLQEDYHDHFSKATRFYEALQDEFHQTDSSHRFEMRSQRSRQAMHRITENMTELETHFTKERQATSHQLDELEEAKKALLSSEEEETK